MAPPRLSRPWWASRWLLTAGLIGAVGLTPTRTEAHEGEPADPHPGAHHADYPNLIGFRVGYLSAFAAGEGELEGQLEHSPALFAGLSYERMLIHNWLELELSVPVAVLFAEQTTVALPIDLHFKKPFHPSPIVSPYVALGPAFDVEVYPDARVFFGGSLAVGTYVWPSRRVGIDIELDYNIVAEDGRPVHELLFAVGPVLRL